MPSYQIGAMVFFDPDGPEGKPIFRVKGEDAPLEERQARLLHLFCRRSGRPLSFDDIAREAYGNPHHSLGSTRQAVTLLRTVFGKVEDLGREAIATVRLFGYQFCAPVRRVDRPRKTAVALGAFDIPQRNAEAELHGLRLREDIASALYDRAASCRLKEDVEACDYLVDLTFLFDGRCADLTVRTTRRESAELAGRHRFDRIDLTDQAVLGEALDRIVIFIEADILRDKWRLFSEGAAPADEQTVEAVLNPLYGLVDGGEEAIEETEEFLTSLGYGAPHLAPFINAALSILYGLWARQTIDEETAGRRNAQALALAEEAVRGAPEEPFAALALARAQRLKKPSGEEAAELLARLEHICERIPGNVLARATYVSALLDDPDSVALGLQEADRLQSMYPHDPAQSMAMTVVAKAQAIRRDVAGARSALEGAVRLAERSSARRRAPPFLRYASAIFYQSAARLAEDAASAARLRTAARRAIERFHLENQDVGPAFDGPAFLLRQLYLAPDWLREMVETSAAELDLDPKGADQ